MSSEIRRRLLDGLWQRLRCPACRLPLPVSTPAEELVCRGCRTRYRVLPTGVPILLDPARREQFRKILEEDTHGRRMANEYERYGTWRASLRSWIKPPSIAYDEDVARKHSWIYDTRGEDTLVLSVGGGPGRENPRVVNLNVDAFDSVDVVGDGMNIPTIDETFDTVTCNAVVEHVPSPAALLSEIHRVLKPGGHVQLMIPFIFPFHTYPGDYRRWTASGVLELTGRFEKLELCVLTGPTSAMLVLFREYLCLIIPGGGREGLRAAINGISGWLTFPFKYLDRRLNRKPEAANMAAALYYLGRKG